MNVKPQRPKKRINIDPVINIISEQTNPKKMEEERKHRQSFEYTYKGKTNRI